jgi:hypothetical protein
MQASSSIVPPLAPAVWLRLIERLLQYNKPFPPEFEFVDLSIFCPQLIAATAVVVKVLFGSYFLVPGSSRLI